MKKLLLSLVALSLVAPALAFAEPSAATDKPAVPAAKSAPETAEKKAEAPKADAKTDNKPATKGDGKKEAGKKTCNPKKSKPCGNACIPLDRACHK